MNNNNTRAFLLLIRHFGRLGRFVFLALLFRTGDDVVDAQKQNGRLDRRLVDLQLDSERFPNARVHLLLDEFTGFAVDAPGARFGRICVGGVFGPQGGKGADCVGAAVLSERTRNYLQSVRDCAVRAVRRLLHQVVG